MHLERIWCFDMMKIFAGVAQLVERQPSKLNVAGSNPVSRSETLSERCSFGLRGAGLNWNDRRDKTKPT